MESQNAFLQDRERQQSRVIASLKHGLMQESRREPESLAQDQQEIERLQAELDQCRLNLSSTEAQLITNKLLYDGELTAIFSKLEEAVARQDGEVRGLQEQLAWETARREELITEAVGPMHEEMRLAMETVHQVAMASPFAVVFCGMIRVHLSGEHLTLAPFSM